MVMLLMVVIVRSWRRKDRMLIMVAWMLMLVQRMVRWLTIL